jgi:hypothetical protein
MGLFRGSGGLVVGLAATLLLVSPSVRSETLSGTYVGTGNNLAILVEIVDAGSKQIVGHYQHIALKADGQLERTNATVNGTSDGNVVVLEIKPVEVLSGSFVLSGKLAGSSLSLSGGGYGKAISLELGKGSLEQFKSFSERIEQEAKKINAARQYDEAVVKSNDIRKRLFAFVGAIKSETDQIPLAEKRLREITNYMQAALRKQQSIHRSDDTAVMIGQIDVAINQAAVQSNQIHLTLTSASEAFLSKRTTLQKDTKDFFQSYCKTAKDIYEEGKRFVQLEKLLESCKALLEVTKDFVSFSEKMHIVLSTAEGTWSEENRKQQATIRESDIASR